MYKCVHVYMYNVKQEVRGVYCMFILEGRGDYPTVGVSGPQAVIGWWWVVSQSPQLSLSSPAQESSSPSWTILNHKEHIMHQQLPPAAGQWGKERLNGVKRGFCSLVLCSGIIYGAILSIALKYPILDILYEWAWPCCCIHGDSNFQSICSPPRDCKSANQKTK